jgi:hypothetical protein
MLITWLMVGRNEKGVKAGDTTTNCLAGLLTKSLVRPGDTGVECGGKRSATPLWLRAAHLMHQWIAALLENGVALRLPPHSPKRSC